MTRTPRLVAAACLAALLLSACGGNQVRTGAAAVVGATRITTEQLQEVVARGLADPAAAKALGADRDGYQRASLSRLINAEVIAEAARRKGVTVTEARVDAKLADFATQAGGRQQLEMQAVQNGIAPQDLRAFVRNIVLDEALGDVLTAALPVPATELQTLYARERARYDQVRSRHILVADAALAARLLARVKADPTTFAALAKEFSTDTSNKDKGGDLGLAGRGAFVKPFEDAVFAAKPGDYLSVKTEFGVHVVNVLERRTTTLAQATPDLRRTALASQREEATQALLRDTAKDLGVTVNPRFGRWSAEEGSVVPVPVDENSVSSPAPSDDPASAPPAGGGGGGAPIVPPDENPAEPDPAATASP